MLSESSPARNQERPPVQRVHITLSVETAKNLPLEE